MCVKRFYFKNDIHQFHGNPKGGSRNHKFHLLSSIYGENYLFWKNGTIRISLQILTGHTLLANDLTICFKKFQKVDPVIVSTDHNDLIVCHVSKIFLEKILKKIDSRFTKNITHWVQICFKCLMRPFLQKHDLHQYFECIL